MARKNYTDEFRRQAVDLYRATPGATLRGSPRTWGSPGTHSTSGYAPRPLRRAPSAPHVPHPARCRNWPDGWAGAPTRAVSPEDELAALRARVATLQTQNDELVAEQSKLATEREILRRAAKYFAGETNW